MITLIDTWNDLKVKKPLRYFVRNGYYYTFHNCEPFHFVHEIKINDIVESGSEQEDFENNYKTQCDLEKHITKIQSLDSTPYAVPIKSFTEICASRISIDFCDKTTWYYDAAQITDEILTTSDNTIYTAIHQNIINLNKITERLFIPEYAVSVKKNDIVITTGFTVNYTNGTVTFDSANQPEDVIKLSYWYAQTSLFEFTPPSNKCWLVNHVESQFSANAIFNDKIVLELIYNPNPYTGNNDLVVPFGEYLTAADFLNKSNEGCVLEPFGELTKKVNILPWSYLSGFKLFPRTIQMDLTKQTEFNALRIRLDNDQPFTQCEIATCAIYFYERSLT